MAASAIHDIAKLAMSFFTRAVGGDHMTLRQALEHHSADDRRLGLKRTVRRKSCKFCCGWLSA